MNQMKIQLMQISASTSEATIRAHKLLVDRPQEKGGADAGPMGGEYFLTSVGGCFMSNLLAAMRAREAKISEVRVDVIGTTSDSPARFTAIELHVSAEGSDQAELDRLVEIADRGCVMMNTLRGKLDLRIRTGVVA